MKYEKIILNLIERVQDLEEQVAEIKKDHQTENVKKIAGDNKKAPSRNEAKRIAMDIIKTKYPNFKIQPASRKEGGGIKILNPKEAKPFILKFYHSIFHSNPSKTPEYGWYTVFASDLDPENIDLCLFSYLDPEENYHYFMFTPEEIIQHRDKYLSSQTDKIFLYLTVEDGKAYEMRESKIEITDKYDNWKAITI